MNGRTLTISRKLRAEDLLSELEAVEKALAALKKKITTAVSAKKPKYGSDAWWDEETKKSLEDYKKGRYIALKNKNDIDKFFTNL